MHDVAEHTEEPQGGSPLVARVQEMMVDPAVVFVRAVHNVPDLGVFEGDLIVCGPDGAPQGVCRILEGDLKVKATARFRESIHRIASEQASKG